MIMINLLKVGTPGKKENISKQRQIGVSKVLLLLEQWVKCWITLDIVHYTFLNSYEITKVIGINHIICKDGREKKDWRRQGEVDWNAANTK